MFSQSHWIMSWQLGYAESPEQHCNYPYAGPTACSSWPSWNPLEPFPTRQHQLCVHLRCTAGWPDFPILHVLRLRHEGLLLDHEVFSPYQLLWLLHRKWSSWVQPAMQDWMWYNGGSENNVPFDKCINQYHNEFPGQSWHLKALERIWCSWWSYFKISGFWGQGVCC